MSKDTPGCSILCSEDFHNKYKQKKAGLLGHYAFASSSCTSKTLQSRKKRKRLVLKGSLCAWQEVISKLSPPLCVHVPRLGSEEQARLIWSRWCGKVIIVLLFTHSQLTIDHLPPCEERADNTLPVLAMWFSHGTCVTHCTSKRNSELLCK